MSKVEQALIQRFLKDESWSVEFIRSDKFAYFLNQIPESVFISNEEGEIIQCNDFASKLTGHPYLELLKMKIEDLVPPRIREKHVEHRKTFFIRPYSRMMGESRLKLKLYTKQKETLIIDAVVFALKTQTGLLAVNLIRDISDEEEEKQRLVTQGNHDLLTGLPNRYFLNEMYQQIVKTAKRQSHQVVLTLFDLDKFKSINDSHGHLIGDDVLKVLAKRLNAILRKNDFIARIGGDEFVILSYANNFSDTLPKKVISELNQPITVMNTELNVGVSMGIIVDDKPGAPLSKLLKQADDLLYQSKRKGGSCFYVGHYQDK